MKLNQAKYKGMKRNGNMLNVCKENARSNQVYQTGQSK
jgi:hypothetical protein